MSFFDKKEKTNTEYQILSEAELESGKKPKTVRLNISKIKIVLGVIIAVAIVGIWVFLFGNSGVQNEMNTYINDRIMPLMEEYVVINEEYENMTGNVTDKKIAAETLRNNTLPDAEELLKKAQCIYVENKEIKTMHDIYIVSLTQFRDSIAMRAEAYETSDGEKEAQSVALYESSIKSLEEYINKRNEIVK